MGKNLDRLVGHVTREWTERGKPEKAAELGKTLAEKLARLKPTKEGHGGA
jgi:hypothetical protein